MPALALPHPFQATLSAAARTMMMTLTSLLQGFTLTSWTGRCFAVGDFLYVVGCLVASLGSVR